MNLPTDRDSEQHFDEPWQAQAFALSLALRDTGHLDWAKWTRRFSRRRDPATAKPDGQDYYLHWVETLEEILTETGIADYGELALLAEAWRRAALATPHGMPIELDNDPMTIAADEVASSNNGIDPDSLGT